MENNSNQCSSRYMNIFMDQSVSSFRKEFNKIFEEIFASARHRMMAVCAIAFEPKPWASKNYFLEQIGLDEFRRIMKDGVI